MEFSAGRADGGVVRKVCAAGRTCVDLFLKPRGTRFGEDQTQEHEWDADEQEGPGEAEHDVGEVQEKEDDEQYQAGDE